MPQALTQGRLQTDKHPVLRFGRISQRGRHLCRSEPHGSEGGALGWWGGTRRGQLSGKVLGREPGGMADVGGEAVASSKLGGPTDSPSFWGPNLRCRTPDSNPGRACPERGRRGKAHTVSARALGALGSVQTSAGDHPSRGGAGKLPLHPPLPPLEAKYR